MSHFCLLKDPQAYVAHKYDLLADEVARAYWLDHFANHFTQTLSHAAKQYGRTAAKQIAAAEQEFADVIESLRARPESIEGGRLNVMSLCRLREKALRGNRLKDPFAHIKERENVSAMDLYPQVVRNLHARSGVDKWLHLVESVFAGNVFDLGSSATMHLALEPTDFLATVDNTRPRPWFIDDFDLLVDDLPDSPPAIWSRAVVFVDNAGSDFILGVMPFVRELALSGTQIVLAANELPSLNDITADEAEDVLGLLAGMDDDLAALVDAGMFEIVSTGNDLPLIDLSDVSDELNEAAANADLIILEGMGRSVESNLDAEFTVDTLWLATIKDEKVADHVGCELFDCVCQYCPIDHDDEDDEGQPASEL